MPFGHVDLKFSCPAKTFTCPANICTSPVKLMYTAGKISTCPDWKITCPVGHITTTDYLPWDKIYMPWACGHALMSSPDEIWTWPFLVKIWYLFLGISVNVKIWIPCNSSTCLFFDKMLWKHKGKCRIQVELAAHKTPYILYSPINFRLQL